jgi:hypothetical protein
MLQNSAAGEISAFTGGPLRLGARPAAGTPYTWQGHSHIIKFHIRPLSVKIISNSGLDITIFGWIGADSAGWPRAAAAFTVTGAAAPGPRPGRRARA